MYDLPQQICVKIVFIAVNCQPLVLKKSHPFILGRRMPVGRWYYLHIRFWL